MLVLLLIISALAIFYYALPRKRDKRFSELDQLKMDILSSVKKKREKEAFEKRCESIILYEDSGHKPKRSFIIDNEGNVEYIKFEEIK